MNAVVRRPRVVLAAVLAGLITRPEPAVAVGPAHDQPATSPASAPRRLGPSCRVHFRASIQQMADTLAPSIETTSRAQLAAATQAWRALRFDSGLTPHVGAPTTTTTNLAAHLPPGVPLPPTLEAFDLLFLHPGDPASDSILTQLDPADGAPAGQTLVFVVNVTGAEFEESRRRLAPRFRGVFPASPAWARFLGVTTYPARVRVRGGVAHAEAGDFLQAEEVSDAGRTGG